MINEIIKKLELIKIRGIEEANKIKDDPKEVERLRSKYIGRNGLLKQIFAEFVSLGEQERKEAGILANQVKAEFIKVLGDLGEKQATDKEEVGPFFDETIEGKKRQYGSIHPITQFIDKITGIFDSMGFEIVEDREVETAEYNFDKLNIPETHPARDMWDTFYIKGKRQKAKGKSKEDIIIDSPLVLRTHTSPVQLRAMETRKPPVRLVVPGRCYRHEATDASHETNFYQLEGLVIDEGISVANMIHTVNVVLKGIFGENVRTRIRPSFFPFVEPGHEVDMSCIICEQKGCSVCGKTGWLEMMGAGMVHPYVLDQMGVDQVKYTGFAFGMGIDRMMMLYYGVDDIRLSYSGDLRFLKQF